MKIKFFNSGFTLFQKIGFFLGPLLAILIFIFFKPDSEHTQITYTAGIAILMAVWWITETIPLAVTALLPVALFPLFGVMNGK